MTPAPSVGPPLVLLAHGTHDPAGLDALAQVRDEVRGRLPGTSVVLSQLGPGPAPVAQAVRGLASGVVVPFLLGAGHHVEVDLPVLAATHRSLRVLEPLGPDPAVVAALADRLGEVVDGRVGAVVLGAAGSTRPRARAQARVAGQALGRRVGAPAVTAFLSGGGCGVDEAVAWARRVAAGAPVVLVSYLLAPGFFQDRLTDAAGRLGVRATAPLGAHPELVGLVADRYRAATG